jgi:trimeric autotransporter adhesin
MPTTSNFGWTTPADTDLVKNGALAIRTLGNGIDTSLLDLKGGTTGQILSKASNTDLDYTWINNDQGDITEVQAGTGISVASGTGPIPVVTNTVATAFDAKGDLVAGTGADTFSKLTVGANNTVLTADSTTATGLKWATPSSGGMTLLSTTTLSGATVTLSSISQDYVNLMLVVEGMTNATADGLFQIQPNGVDTQQRISIIMNNNTVTTTADYQAKINSGIALARSNAGNVFTCTFTNYTSTTSPKNFHLVGYYINTSSAFGAINSAGGGTASPFAAITSLVLSNAGGNFSAGTARLYGVK